MSRPKNDTFLRALLKEPTEYTPLWLMRQAGRYLPEYCETRKRAGNFLNLCKSPAMACEVTLQPLARYDLDAAILFSDILTVPDAMGLGLYFTEGEGPKFERPLREEWAINDLTAPDPNDHLRYVMDAVSEIRRALDNSLAADRLCRSRCPACRRTQSQPARCALAAGGQAGAAVLAGPPRCAGSELLPAGHARQGVAAQRVVDLVCVLPT